MFTKRRLILVGILCVFAIGASLPGIEHFTGSFKIEKESLAQAPSGVVYIESNIGHVNGKNSILAYRRDSAGHLTLLGEYLTGGTGVHPIESTVPTLATTLGPLDSDQNLILNKTGTRLFAVNSGSDTIAVFDVKSDGSLVHVAGSPFPSGGVNPVSVGLASVGTKPFEPASNGDILVVANKDYDLTRPGFNAAQRAPNYTTFRVNPQGKLIRIPDSTIVAAQGGGIGLGAIIPTQALVSPTGRLVFDTDLFGFRINSFVVEPNGRLRRVASRSLPASEFIPQPVLPVPQKLVVPLGLQAHPRQAVFYAGMVLEGRMAVLTYNSSGLFPGDFQFIRSVEAGAGICWIAINAAGTRLYSANTLANTVSVLDSTDALNPVKIQEFALAGPPAGPFQLGLDARGEYLYVITQKTLDVFPEEANALHVLQLSPTGTIATQTDRIVLPVHPSAPQGVVAR